MKLALDRARSRWLFLAVILLVAASIAFPAGKVWLAAHWSASSKPELWLRAAKLEPDNAAYWHQLGLFKQWDFEQGDLRQAIPYYQKATETDPRSDRYWMDLAGAYETMGEIAQAQAAFEKAQSSHPASSEVAWRYGSFLLRQRDFPAAYAEIHRAIESSPNLAESAFSQCWKANPDIAEILNNALPAESRFYLLAIDYLLSQQQIDPALVVWNRLLALKQHFEMRRVAPLVNQLIQTDRIEEARRVWQQALEATNWPRDSNAGSSLIFDGKFEHGFVNGGFDWREQPVPGASFEFDTTVFHSGTRSLRITFDGTGGNLDFRHLWQFVPVEPRHRYHFAAYLRTEGITTDSGMRFLILDAQNSAALQISTLGLVGTQPWSRVEAEFETGAKTRVLAVTLQRSPTWHFDNQLRGTVWVDDACLTPVVGSAGGSQ